MSEGFFITLFYSFAILVAALAWFISEFWLQLLVLALICTFVWFCVKYDDF